MTTRLAWVIVAATGSLAHAEPQAPIPVKSVTVKGNPNKNLWKVVAGEGEAWCQAKISPNAKMVIDMVGTPLLDDIHVDVEGDVTEVVVVSDGTEHFLEVGTDKKVGAPLKTTEIGEIEISLKGTGRGCVNKVTLGDPQTIYSTNDGATLWKDVAAARAALVACDKKQIAQAFAFPFTTTWPDMDQNGMKWPHTKYTSADKLAGGCQNIHIAKGLLKLDPEPKLTSKSHTTASVEDGDGMRWDLTLVKGHWRVEGFGFPGA